MLSATRIILQAMAGVYDEEIRQGATAQGVDQSSFTGQIGAIIRATREKAGKTVEWCATAAEVSVAAWYHFESGRHLATEKLPRIAAALAVKTRSLIPSD